MSQYEVFYKYKIDNESYNKALDTMTKKLSAFLNIVRRYERVMAKMGKATEKATGAQLRATTSTKGLARAVESVTGPAQRHGALQQKLAVQYGATTAKIAVQKMKLGELSDKFREFSTRVGSLRSMMLGFYAVQGTKAVVSAGIEFSRQIQKIQANTAATATQMERLRDAAFQLNIGSIFDASEIASAMYMLTRTGSTIEETLDMMQGVVNLATIAEVAPEQAATMMRSVMAMFGKSAEDSDHIADVMAYAQTKSMLSAESLFEALKNVGGVAHGLGLSLEETVGHLAGVAKSVPQGQKAGTLLMNMYLRMANVSEKGKKVLRKYGLRAEDYFTDGVLDSTRFMQALTEKGVSIPEFKDLFEIRGLRAGAALTDWLGTGDVVEAGFNGNIDSMNQKFGEFMAGIENIDGYAEKMAAHFMEGLFGATEKLRGAWVNFKIAIGDTIGVALIPLMGYLEKFFVWMTSKEASMRWLANGLKGLIGIFLIAISTMFFILIPMALMAGSLEGLIWSWSVLKGGVATAAIAAKLAAIKQGVLALSLKLTSTALWANTAAWLANPLMWIPAVIVAVVGGFAYLVYKLGSVTDALKLVGWAIMQTLLTPLHMTIGAIRILLGLFSGLGRIFGFKMTGVDAARAWLADAQSSMFAFGGKDVAKVWVDKTAETPSISPKAAGTTVNMTDDRPVFVNVKNTLDPSTRAIQTEINQGLGWTGI